MMVDEKGEIVLMGGEKYIRKEARIFQLKKQTTILQYTKIDLFVN